MSWLARPFASLTAVDDDDAGAPRSGNQRERLSDGTSQASPAVAEVGRGDGSEGGDPGRGVKEDLSELTKTLTRQFWGVASFLAPPPTTSTSSAGSDPRPSEPAARLSFPHPTVSAESEYSDVVLDSPRRTGIGSDFAVIGGRFRNEISKLSHNKAVMEISKIASSFLRFGPDGDAGEEGDEDDRSGGAIGVTEEVLAFARNISMHPETWLDFPLLPDDDALDDFDMSDAQQEHALAVEHLVPRLAALRIEICPSYMSEGCFWKVYFVLLHPRLNKHDAELLSTPQIAEARTLLLRDLQRQSKPVADRSTSIGSCMKEHSLSGARVTASSGLYENVPHRKSSSDEENLVGDSETEKYSILSPEIKIVDKSVIQEEMPAQANNVHGDSIKIPIEKYEDSDDKWLEEENVEFGNLTTTSLPMGNEDDVSFSDLEDDEYKAPVTSKSVINEPNSQAAGSKGWVQLNQTFVGSVEEGTLPNLEAKEANEWSVLDDIDVM